MLSTYKTLSINIQSYKIRKIYSFTYIILYNIIKNNKCKYRKFSL